MENGGFILVCLLLNRLMSGLSTGGLGSSVTWGRFGNTRLNGRKRVRDGMMWIAFI